MGFEVVHWSLDEVVEHLSALKTAYHTVYSESPYSEPWSAAESFGEGLVQYGVGTEGFRCVIARQADQGSILGFALGSLCLQGGWWRERAIQGLEADVVERWFSSAFELFELGVVPEARRQGIGRRLHDEILRDTGCSTAVLNVLEADIPAVVLYKGQGWVPIRQNVQYKPGDHGCMIMGLDLMHKAGN